MNRNTFWGTFALVLLLALAGLVSQQEAGSISSLDNSPTSEPKLIATEIGMSKLVRANNRFSFDLFAQLQQPSSPPQNTFISPQSIAIALAMARNGTKGETFEQIDRTLGLEKLDPSEVDESYSKLIQTLNTADPSIKLAIANSLWVNRDIKLKDRFIRQNQDSYQGKITNLDFADPAATETINQWVASNTAHKIPQIVDSVSPDDAVYLINAIYFQGSWSKKFDPRQTTEKPFFRRSQTSKPVAMMSQTGDYRYYANEQFQAVRLPYGKGEMGMYIFLPQPEVSLEQFNQQLNLENWQEWLAQMRSQPGNISLPKFKLEYATELKEVLSSLGTTQIFNPSQANFSAMTDSSVAIDTVKHKAVIEVDEEGTEAAGVTSIGIRITSAMPEKQPFNLEINRPFFFVIQDDITDTILFMGNVFEPQ